MILVTGGSGYLGRALVESLLAEGESVRVLSRRACDTPAELYLGDMMIPVQLDGAMQGVKVVYHLAALVNHYATQQQLRLANVQGTINVVESAIRQGVARVVYCSSVSAEQGGGSTAYGRSKIEAEQALASYHSKMPIIILRPGPIYDEERKNLQRLIRYVQLSKICPKLLPDTEIHLASRRNVVEAFLKARRLGRPAKAYVVCDRHSIKRSVLTDIIQQKTATLNLSVPLKLVAPLLQLLVFGCEFLHKSAGIQPLIDRHYLKVLMRERQYQITPTIADLGYAPASTEEHFSLAVKACLTH